MKVIIAGSRTITNIKAVTEAIKESGFDITEGVCGEARGVDECGKQYCIVNNIPWRGFPANWTDWSGLPPNKVRLKRNAKGMYNSLAGINRNQKMADYAEALVAIVSGKSPGTRDMIRRAKANNIKIHVKEI